MSWKETLRWAALPLLILSLILLLRPAPMPQRLSSTLNQATQAQSAGFYHQAALAWEGAVRLAPWRWDWIEQLGLAWIAAGEPERGAQILSAAAPHLTAQGWLAWADTLERLRQTPQSLEVWQQMAANQALEKKARLEACRKLALAARQAADWPRYREVLSLWQSLDASQPAVWDGLALVSLIDRPDEALELFRQAGSLSPAYTRRYEVMRKANNLAGLSAEAAYQRLMLARALGSLGEWDIAQVLMQQAVELAPNYAEAWAFLAETRQQVALDQGSGLTSTAGWPELEKALSLQRNSPLVQALVGIYYRRQGQPALALVFIQAAANSEPEQAYWQVEMANALIEMGDIVSALKHMQAAAQISPSDPIYWRMLAQFCAEHSIEVRNVGLPAARQAVMLNNEDAASLAVMGQVLLALEDTASAERFLQQAIQKDENEAAAHFWLGQLYIRELRYREAAVQLETAARLSEKTVMGKLARRMLEQIPGGSG